MTHSELSPADPRSGLALADRDGPRLRGADIMSGNADSTSMTRSPNRRASGANSRPFVDVHIDPITDNSLELSIVSWARCPAGDVLAHFRDQ